MCTKESTTSAREMACVVLLLSLLFLRKIFFLRFFADSTIKFDFVLTPRVLRKKGGVFFFCVDEIKRTNAPFRKRCVIRAAFLGRRAFISVVF